MKSPRSLPSSLSIMTEHMRQTSTNPNSGPAGHEASNLKGAEPSTNPPSYDYATGGSNTTTTKHSAPHPTTPKPGSSTPYPAPPQVPQSLPSPGPSGPYYYQHPTTGHTISSPFPPDHAEMICLQEGRHIRASRFGILGILAAVVWFPLGIGLCLLDRRVVCKRCGRVIDGGISC